MQQVEIMRILRDFHRVSGFRVSIHDADLKEIFAYPAQSHAFCRAIQQDKKVLASCRKTDALMLQKVKESGETILYRCPQGLCEAAAPIYHYGVLSGYLMIGQMRDSEGLTISELCAPFRDNAAAAKAAQKLPSMKEEEMRAYLSIITVIAQYLTGTNRVQTDNGRLPELIAQYLRKNYAQKITLQSLSRRFGYCNATLTKGFRAEYGCTIFSYLRDIRLDIACKMLRESDLSVKEIAAACGMDDQNYFSRVFKKRCGCSPSAYR